MNPWPLARTRLDSGDELLILRARIAAAPRAAAPGEVLEALPRLVVACGEGALELLEVQTAGRKAMDAASWLRGARVAAGARLLRPGEPA
jgi:methionyl-tRNA formyltransferase